MNAGRSPLLVAGLAAAALAAGAQEPALPAPGSTALVEDAAAWDGKTVRFVGEAIGEAMRRGDHAWLHLNDDAYGLADADEEERLAGYNGGIAVWVGAGPASGITSFGDYHHHGDLVEVTGVFHAACSLHGGDMDVHASSLRVIRPGYARVHPVPASRLVAAAILAVTALALLAAQACIRRRGDGTGRPTGRGRIRQPPRATLGRWSTWGDPTTRPGPD